MKTSKFSRRNVLLGAAASCVLPGIGRTQERDIEGGIGGTGIVGLLTDFGSLIVGGRLVRTDAQTVVSDAFGMLEERNLRLGDSLTVEAAGPVGGLVARRVHLTHPLVGTIERVTGRVAVINGVRVALPSNGPAFGVGDRVAVSGLWRGDQVIASRITPARSSLDLVSGDVGKSGLGQSIGGVAVRSVRVSRLAEGSFATVLGRYDPGSARLVAQTVQEGRFFEAAGPLRQLAVEGFLEPTRRAPGYRISGLGHSFARNLRLEEHTGQRKLFSGRYTGQFAANRAVTLPENLDARRRILRNLSREG